MLPLTQETRNILDKHLFAKLPAGAYVVNVARGDLLVEEDLLAAIDSGRLSGACLDVFRQEPLPADHSFWGHPAVRITPHTAALTNPKTAAPQILENYHRALGGKPLCNRVDVRRGY